ncbi:hypothetical protein [Pseudomonas sp. A34-9]|uniref:hypothetical protein n=1 Tax=Pseudomonas sp. A34-9 TaxID=3034675 RepID=UPI00240E6D7D|nr:hypothetical protein [Pseudomonas sp. A34-9]
MAKPPKQGSGINLPDTSTTTRPPSQVTPTGNRLNIDLPGRFPEGSGQRPDSSQDVSADVSRLPSVLVSAIPGREPVTAQAAMDSMTWPADRVHMLHPLGSDSGLFTSPDGALYAHIENAGHLRVERQRDGRFQVPFDDTPQLPGPFLNKSERQATWTFERPDWLTQEAKSDTPSSRTTEPAPVEAPIYLDPADAAQLSPAKNTLDGIRYDKHRKTYVDTAFGTVMVRRNADGEYQQALATATDSPNVFFEQIPRTKLWRRKTLQVVHIKNRSQQGKRRPPHDIDEPTPGPSKRGHLENDPNTAQTLTENLLSANPQAINLSYGLWRNWGKTLQSPLGQHIEIEGLHYRIVPQLLDADSRLVYVQHPLFSPALYDAFEYMLRDNPSLQPKWAIKIEHQWTVLDSGFPFEMPITQYVSRTFRHLSDSSVSSLARALFNQANRSEVITGHGLSVMIQTFRYWKARNYQQPPRAELADPLLTLRNLSGERDTSTIPLSVGEGLQRLDLDPGRFPYHWNKYATAPTLPNLRKMFSDVLEDDGYVISSASHTLGEDTLLFHRKTIDAVFVLKLPPLINGRLHRSEQPGAELTGPVLQTLIGQQQQPLVSYLIADKVVYLLGGVQTDALGQTTLFVFRES